MDKNVGGIAAMKMSPVVRANYGFQLMTVRFQLVVQFSTCKNWTILEPQLKKRPSTVNNR